MDPQGLAIVTDDKGYRIRGSLRLKRHREWRLSENVTILAIGKLVIPSLRANGSRECAPDDRLRQAIHLSAERKYGLLRRFAPRNDGREHSDALPKKNPPEKTSGGSFCR